MAPKMERIMLKRYLKRFVLFLSYKIFARLQDLLIVLQPHLTTDVTKHFKSKIKSNSVVMSNNANMVIVQFPHDLKISKTEHPKHFTTGTLSKVSSEFPNM